jgi:hypothetical protein
MSQAVQSSVCPEPSASVTAISTKTMRSKTEFRHPANTLHLVTDTRKTRRLVRSLVTKRTGPTFQRPTLFQFQKKEPASEMR